MKLEQIKKIVEHHTDLNLSNTSRVQNFVYTRAMYFKLCREYTLYSLSDIGKSVGKNHATVLHGLKLFDDWICEHEETYMDKLKKIDDDIRKKFHVRGGRVKTREYYKRKYVSLVNEHRALMRKHRNLKKLLDI